MVQWNTVFPARGLGSASIVPVCDVDNGNKWGMFFSTNCLYSDAIATSVKLSRGSIVLKTMFAEMLSI
jgi:hypothetical protein